MNNSVNQCFKCAKILPDKGYFCGGCLSQIRCKECENVLEKDAIGCTHCGEPITTRNSISMGNGYNTFTLHETNTDRTVKATFSDSVGKEFAGIITNAMAGRVRIPERSASLPQENTVDDTVYQEIMDQNTGQPNSEETLQAIPVTKSNSSVTPKLDILPLLTVSMRKLPGTETEWVVLYAYYASNFGANVFTRQDINNLYDESRRKTRDKINALSSNLNAAVQSGRINALADGYSILQPGIDLAKEILNRTKPSGTTKDKRSKNAKDRNIEIPQAIKVKKPAKSNDKSKRLGNLDFYPNGKDSLSVYVSKFAIKSNFERILVFISYLKEILSIDSVDYDHIYSCFDELKLEIPSSVSQTTRNVASAKRWIDTSDSKNIVITTAGKNKLRHWDKND